MDAAKRCPYCGGNPGEGAYCTVCGSRLGEGELDGRILERAWRAVGLRNGLRNSGWGSIFWGVVAIFIGLSSLHDSSCNGVLALIGLFLIITGISTQRSPSAGTMQADAVGLLLIGAWNIMITIMNMSAGGGANFFGILGVMQIVWGIQRFRQVSSFKEVESVNKAILVHVEKLVRGIRQSSSAGDLSLIEFRAEGKNWKAWLSPQMVVLVDALAQDVRFLPPSKFALSVQEATRPGKPVKLSLRVGPLTWNGTADARTPGRYEAIIRKLEQMSIPVILPVEPTPPGILSSEPASSAASVAPPTPLVESQPLRAPQPQPAASMPATAALKASQLFSQAAIPVEGTQEQRPVEASPPVKPIPGELAGRIEVPKAEAIPGPPSIFSPQPPPAITGSGKAAQSLLGVLQADAVTSIPVSPAIPRAMPLPTTELARPARRWWLWLLGVVTVLVILAFTVVSGILAVRFLGSWLGSLSSSPQPMKTVVVLSIRLTPTVSNTPWPSPTLTVTPTPQSSPTSTPTPIPSRTPDLTKTAQVEANRQATLTAVANATLAAEERLGWQTLLSDDFSSDTGLWPVEEVDDERAKASYQITGGKYHWDFSTYHGSFWSQSVEYPTIKDFMVSVDVEVLNGAEDCAYGLIFRDTAGFRFYHFGVSELGQYAVWMYEGNEWSVLRDWTNSSAIYSGGVNHLAVVAQGIHFMFYINDQLVDELDDRRLVTGDIGLSIDIFNPGVDVSVEFDNFEIKGP